MPHWSLLYQPSAPCPRCCAHCGCSECDPLLTSEPVDSTWPGFKVIKGHFDSVQTGAISRKSLFFCRTLLAVIDLALKKGALITCQRAMFASATTELTEFVIQKQWPGILKNKSPRASFSSLLKTKPKKTKKQSIARDEGPQHSMNVKNMHDHSSRAIFFQNFLSAIYH